MIREIVREISFLSLPATDATAEDLPIMQDLFDTLAAHKNECVGMAANMIGKNKKIIIFNNNGAPMSVFNPQIVKKSDPYETVESCLSLEGSRRVTRYKTIKLIYQTADMKTRQKTFTGYTAQIIQHEVDHLKGIII